MSEWQKIGSIPVTKSAEPQTDAATVRNIIALIDEQLSTELDDDRRASLRLARSRLTLDLWSRQP